MAVMAFFDSIGCKDDNNASSKSILTTIQVRFVVYLYFGGCDIPSRRVEECKRTVIVDETLIEEAVWVVTTQRLQQAPEPLPTLLNFVTV